MTRFAFAHRLLALALLLIALPACGEFDFQGQDLALRHDAEADTLDLELIYKGVRLPQVTTRRNDVGSKGADGVCEAIEQVSEGRRYFMLFYHVMALDIDWATTQLQAKQAKNPSEVNRALLALIDGLSVRSASVFLDPNGRLGLRQEIHLKNASQAMALLNRQMHSMVLEDVASGVFAKQTADFFDDATRAALIAEAKSQVNWVLWNGADLTFDLPIGSASSARLLAQLLQEQASEDEASVRAFTPLLFGLVSDLRVASERLRMTLAADANGRLSVQMQEDAREYDASLLQKLRERGFVFSPDPTVGG